MGTSPSPPPKSPQTSSSLLHSTPKCLPMPTDFSQRNDMLVRNYFKPTLLDRNLSPLSWCRARNPCQIQQALSRKTNEQVSELKRKDYHQYCVGLKFINLWFKRLRGVLNKSHLCRVADTFVLLIPRQRAAFIPRNLFFFCVAPAQAKSKC